MPEEWEITTWISWEDSLANILLFVPFGFFFRLILPREKSSAVIWAGLAGLTFSLLVETAQLFLPGRYSAPADVVTNGAGALAGALVTQLLLKWFPKRPRRLFLLDYPLVHLFYLMIPFMWLGGLSESLQGYRVWLAILSGVMGAVLAGELYANLNPRFSLKSMPISLFLFGTWFFTGQIILLRKSGRFLLVTYGVLTCYLILRGLLKLPGSRQNGRFELPTLRKILPILVVYLVILNYFPFKFPEFHFTVSWTPLELDTDPTQQSILRLLEFVAGVTLAGYMIAEMLGRWSTRNEWEIFWLYTFLASLVAELEFLRALNPLYGFCLIRLILGIIGAWSGIFIYRRQLREIQNWREHELI